MDGSVVLDACIKIDCLDPKSENHAASRDVIERLVANQIVCYMPMHGLFEIKCTLERRSAELDWQLMKDVLPESSPLSIQFVPIDLAFVQKHVSSNTPKLRAGDLLYFVVAQELSIPLFTNDKELLATRETHPGLCFCASEAVKYLDDRYPRVQ